MPATSRCDRPGAILCRLPLSRARPYRASRAPSLRCPKPSIAFLRRNALTSLRKLDACRTLAAKAGLRGGRWVVDPPLEPGRDKGDDERHEVAVAFVSDYVPRILSSYFSAHGRT